MARPTRIIIQSHALLHNLNRVRQLAPGKKIIAMVKANAYGCGMKAVVPVLEGHVDAFGVACLSEAFAIRALGSQAEIILFQGVFDVDEFQQAVKHRFSCVIHQPQQLEWLLKYPLPHALKIWVKVNTGMNRLGFMPNEVSQIFHALQQCPWVDANIGLMTHFACADDQIHARNDYQITAFKNLHIKGIGQYSAANSAVIFNYPELHGDVVRPGIMLYGVSPFSDYTGRELGLIPVMHFTSALSTIHHYPAYSPVGYGAEWQSPKPSVIGIVPVGYGDGYPRHIAPGTCVWINGQRAPVAGRISMDMMAIDLTACPSCHVGDAVELWGKHIPVEEVARSAGTIAYELLCQVTDRIRQ